MKLLEILEQDNNPPTLTLPSDDQRGRMEGKTGGEKRSEKKNAKETEEKLESEFNSALGKHFDILVSQFIALNPTAGTNATSYLEGLGKAKESNVDIGKLLTKENKFDLNLDDKSRRDGMLVIIDNIQRYVIAQKGSLSTSIADETKSGDKQENQKKLLKLDEFDDILEPIVGLFFELSNLDNTAILETNLDLEKNDLKKFKNEIKDKVLNKGESSSDLVTQKDIIDGVWAPMFDFGGFDIAITSYEKTDSDYSLVLHSGGNDVSIAVNNNFKVTDQSIAFGPRKFTIGSNSGIYELQENLSNYQSLFDVKSTPLVLHFENPDNNSMIDVTANHDNQSTTFQLDVSELAAPVLKNGESNLSELVVGEKTYTISLVDGLFTFAEKGGNVPGSSSVDNADINKGLSEKGHFIEDNEIEDVSQKISSLLTIYTGTMDNNNKLNFIGKGEFRKNKENDDVAFIQNVLRFLDGKVVTVGTKNETINVKNTSVKTNNVDYVSNLDKLKDAKFGPNTANAIYNFQNFYHTNIDSTLKMDGMAGFNTLTAMKSIVDGLKTTTQ